MRKENKRELILNALEELLPGRRFHEITLDEVAKAAQVGKGTIYLYFQDKDALFAELVCFRLGKLQEQLAGLAGCFFERFKTSNDSWSDWYKFTGDKYPYAATNTELQRSVMPTNLLKTQRYAVLNKGVSITPTKDGTYRLNGTASAGFTVPKIGFFKDKC